MAKRGNPFLEDYIPQSKTHVSMKQFNNNEDRLQKVYEKTLKLLFKGAQRSQANNVICNKINEINTADNKDKMKQLFIGKNGTLLHSGIMVHQKSRTNQCQCGGDGKCQCAFCEVFLCLTCQLLCTCCEQAHCRTCTLIGLEGSEVCVSCYS